MSRKPRMDGSVDNTRFCFVRRRDIVGNVVHL
jgi:hypothetical protein